MFAAVIRENKNDPVERNEDLLIYQVKNEITGENVNIKVLVFKCLNSKEQNAIVAETEFCKVGPYLVQGRTKFSPEEINRSSKVGDTLKQN